MITPTTQEQTAAVLSRAPRVRVIAGPGTGKTAVVVARAKFFLEELGVHPSDITILTFTRAAAAELRQRVAGVIAAGMTKNPATPPPEEIQARAARVAGKMFIGTMHSWCLSFLEINAKLIGMDYGIAVLNEADREDILRELGQKYRQEALDDLYRATKRGLNALDYDDLLSAASGLLRENSIVRETTRAHVVIYDEFQDVSQEEYDILRLLDPRWLTVVGDPDQTIYEFRGSRPDLLLGFDGEGVKTFTLTENFRSGKTIVAGANSLIAHNENRYPIFYRSRDISWLCAGSFIEISDHNCGDLVGTQLAKTLKRLLPPTISGYSDIAVLSRTNWQLKTAAKILGEMGIPYYYLSGEKELWKNKEVRCLIALAQWARNMAYDMAIRYAIRCGIASISEAELADANRNAVEHGFSLWEIVKTMPGAVELRQALGILQRDGVAALSALEQIIDLFKWGLSRHIIHFMAQVEAWATLQEGSSRNAGLNEFAAWTATRELQEVGVVDGRGVALSTLHGAKGMEWTHVIIFPCEAGEIPHHKSDNIEEERRLFYVGVTRARRRVVLLVGDGKQPSPFLEELRRGLIEDIPQPVTCCPFFGDGHKNSEVE